MKKGREDTKRNGMGSHEQFESPPDWFDEPYEPTELDLIEAADESELRYARALQ